METFLLIYAALIFSSVFLLNYFFSVSAIDIYLTAFAIEFFVAVLATSPYNHEETKRQMFIGAVLLVIFAGVVAERMLSLLK